MRTIIAGSRSITDYEAVVWAMKYAEEHLVRPTVIISGTARGVDLLGERWADERGIPIERYPADWKKHGRAAGPIRNQQMAEVADALVVIWDGRSKGTKHMIRTMTRKKGSTVVYVKWPLEDTGDTG